MLISQSFNRSKDIGKGAALNTMCIRIDMRNIICVIQGNFFTLIVGTGNKMLGRFL
jgi:hypothetical protein